MRSRKVSVKLNTQSGFTLIELLIAFLVLSVGLIGLSKLQIGGIRSNSNAYIRSQAVIISEDLTERMRVNRESSKNGDYAAIDFSAINCPSPPAAMCAAWFGEEVIDCSPQEMVVFDSYEAYCALQELIPGAVLAVSMSGNYYNLQISWQEVSINGSEQAKSVQMKVEP